MQINFKKTVTQDLSGIETKINNIKRAKFAIIIEFILKKSVYSPKIF